MFLEHEIDILFIHYNDVTLNTGVMAAEKMHFFCQYHNKLYFKIY